MSAPLLPIRPESQDIAALYRKAEGLPPKTKTTPVVPNVTDQGDLETNMRDSIFGFILEMPDAVGKEFGFEPGLLVSLKVKDVTIRGLVLEHENPDPSAFAAIKREQKKPGSFATLRSSNDNVIVNMLKTGRNGSPRIPLKDSVPATLSICKDREGNPQTIDLNPGAKGNTKTCEVPLKLGKAGPKVAGLTKLIDKCFAWTQICVFELDGKTRAVAVNICPPQYRKENGVKKVSMAAEITASVSTYIDGYMQEDQAKRMRKYPEGIARAFDWAAKQTKGGTVLLDRFEIELDDWNRSRSVNEKLAKEKAIEAWKEVLGIS
ncbi:MAG: hypothetical protein WBD31_06040 [Rubripirellula sp.]